ncbi:hypothetical protein [Nonomuraea basaltis]|uniref:hypothetical protein n=1 Tax=Nonomuraea basaltis TaxID=2495887 RepID=UPI00110C43E6|nr:hypothetical protein [Nonomuraea basaltis]TMR91325.1 hypothetical protein EJK15_50560 [Nonomuraea basaltis]
MLENTLPTTPGALIGYRKDGRPIHLIAGGAPEDGEAQPQQEDQNPPAQAEVTPPEPPAADDTAVNPDAKRVDQLPSWAQKLIKDTRAEAADWRSKLKDAQKAADDATAQQGPSQDEITEQVKTDFAQQIAKALGLAAEEESPIDPQQVIETLTSERDTTAKERDAEKERHRRALIELAVHRASQKVGADPDALLDSRNFLKAVRDLDPDAEEFSTTLTETIQTAVENNPKFKAATQAGPPARSGGEFTGGPGGRAPSSEPSIDEFRARRKKRASS